MTSGGAVAKHPSRPFHGGDLEKECPGGACLLSQPREVAVAREKGKIIHARLNIINRVRVQEILGCDSKLVEHPSDRRDPYGELNMCGQTPPQASEKLCHNLRPLHRRGARRVEERGRSEEVNLECG